MKTLQVVALLAVVAVFVTMSVPVFAAKPAKPVPVFCQQVITFAENPDTGECVAFHNPCDVPEGWQACPGTVLSDP